MTIIDRVGDEFEKHRRDTELYPNQLALLAISTTLTPNSLLVVRYASFRGTKLRRMFFTSDWVREISAALSQKVVSREENTEFD